MQSGRANFEDEFDVLELSPFPIAALDQLDASPCSHKVKSFLLIQNSILSIVFLLPEILELSDCRLHLFPHSAASGELLTQSDKKRR